MNFIYAEWLQKTIRHFLLFGGGLWTNIEFSVSDKSVFKMLNQLLSVFLLLNDIPVQIFLYPTHDITIQPLFISSVL